MALNKVPYVDGVTVITAENLNDIQDAIIALENAPAQGLTEDMKQALLQIARKVAYIDDQGQTYYDDLYDAFYPPKTVVLITAVFEQGSTVIYDDTALDDLKQYLTVTAKYDDNTTAILADSAYTLSGLLEAPSSTVTVAYNGLTTTFTVDVTARPTLSSISAVYTQSGTVYDTDTLDSLKADLVVTAHYSDSSTATVAAADYTLSGTLAEGTQTITVSYGGKTTTFSVTVTAWTLTWSYLDGGLPNVVAPNDWTATHTGSESHASFVDGEGIKWTGMGGGETYTPKNYTTTSEGTMEIVVNFPEESENLNVRATLNTASDTLIGFIFSQGIKVNGSGPDYSFIPNTSVVLGTDNTLRVVRANNIGKVYLNGVMVYSGELRSLSGTNNVLISPFGNMTQSRTVYVRAIRFKHLQ